MVEIHTEAWWCNFGDHLRIHVRNDLKVLFGRHCWIKVGQTAQPVNSHCTIFHKTSLLQDFLYAGERFTTPVFLGNLMFFAMHDDFMMYDVVI